MFFLFEYKTRRTTLIYNIFCFHHFRRTLFSENVPKFCQHCSKRIWIRSKIHWTPSYCMHKTSILRHVSWWNILPQSKLMNRYHGGSNVDHNSLNRLYWNQNVASGGSNLKFEWHPEVHRFSQMGIRRFRF